jgi:hypothetical protein
MFSDITTANTKIYTHSLGLSTLCSLHVQHDLAILLLSTHHLGVELELQALLGQNLLEVLANLGVHSSSDGTEVFDNGHFSTETRPDGTKLETDDTATDDDHLARQHTRQ